MATHSSILAWKIPWMKKPGGLQSMGSLRVGHMISDVECLLMGLLSICMSLEKGLFRTSAHFLLDCLGVFLILSYMNYMYIWEINTLLVTCKYFLLFFGLSFHFVYGFLCCAEVFKFN